MPQLTDCREELEHFRLDKDKRSRWHTLPNKRVVIPGQQLWRQRMAPFDLDACIQQLLRKQLLHEALLREICEKTKEVLMRESNVVHVSAPVTVVGDIHG